MIVAGVEVEGSNAAAALHIIDHMEAVRWVERRDKPPYGTISTVHTKVRFTQCFSTRSSPLD